VTITVNRHRKFRAPVGEPLLYSLERAGYQLEAGYRSGHCSLCRVKIIDGAVVNGPDARIRRSDQWTGYTYACVAFPTTDLMIQI